MLIPIVEALLVVLAFISVVFVYMYLQGFLFAKMCKWNEIMAAFPLTETDNNSLKSYDRMTGNVNQMGMRRSFSMKIYSSGISIRINSRFFDPIFVPWKKIKDVMVDTRGVVLVVEYKSQLRFCLPIDALNLIEELAPDLWHRKQVYKMSK
jgi:hypothetical protein